MSNKKKSFSNNISISNLNNDNNYFDNDNYDEEYYDDEYEDNINEIDTPCACNELFGMQIIDNKILISDKLKYHIDKCIPLSENVFRIYSNSYFDLINEVRDLYNNHMINLCNSDKLIIESDLGKTAFYKDEIVYLDAPLPIDEFELINEAIHRGKKVKLNRPFRTPGGPKKFAVYVKGKNNKVKIVRFGDPNLRIRNANKKAAKSFKARHKCHLKKDKTKAGYWSCNVARYRKLLGLKSSSRW